MGNTSAVETVAKYRRLAVYWAGQPASDPMRQLCRDVLDSLGKRLELANEQALHIVSASACVFFPRGL